MNLNEGIRRARKWRDMTQLELAGKVGCNIATIKNWESGRNDPTHENIMKLCEILNVSLDFLTGVSDDPNEVSNAFPPDTDYIIAEGNKKFTLIEQVMNGTEDEAEKLLQFLKIMRGEA